MNREELGYFPKNTTRGSVNPEEHVAPPAFLGETDTHKAFKDLIGNRSVDTSLIKGLIDSRKITPELFSLMVKNQEIPLNIVVDLERAELIDQAADGSFVFLEDMTDYMLSSMAVDKFLRLNGDKERISTLKLKTLMREHSITESDFNALVKTGHISKQNIDDLVKGDDIEWDKKTGKYIIIEELMPKGEFFNEEGEPTPKLVAQHNASTNLREKKEPPKPIEHIKKPK